MQKSLSIKLLAGCGWFCFAYGPMQAPYLVPAEVRPVDPGQIGFAVVPGENRAVVGGFRIEGFGSLDEEPLPEARGLRLHLASLKEAS